jgi:hypothetical protein
LNLHIGYYYWTFVNSKHIKYEDQWQTTEETVRLYWNVVAYLKEITAPLAKDFPSLTRQSLYWRRLNLNGLTSIAELNMPHATWMSEMSQPLTHVFWISTVYVGIPPIGAVGPCLIAILSLLHLSSIFPEKKNSLETLNIQLF